MKLVATAQGNRRPMASEPTSESSQSFGPFHMARAALPGREMATEAGQVSKNPRRYVVSCSNGSAKLTLAGAFPALEFERQLMPPSSYVLMLSKTVVHFLIWANAPPLQQQQQSSGLSTALVF